MGSIDELHLDRPEIILNLWYVCDVDLYVYSLRARAYLGTGSDEEKLALLKKHSTTDYLIARLFQIPKGMTTHGLPVIPKAGLKILDSPIAIFEEAIKAIQNDLPNQTPLDIPKSPIVCVTTLVGDEGGNIYPVIDGEEYFSKMDDDDGQLSLF
jgi:hypothetical protein